MMSASDSISSTYRASDGAAYERFLGRGSRLLAPPFAEFARPPDHGRVLDVGCGTGSLALALTERGAPDRVAALDIATPYIAFARSRAGAAGIGFAVARRRRGGSMGFSRRARVPAPLLGQRGRARPGRRGDAGSALLGPARLARRTAGAVARLRTHRGRARLDHDPHGIRRLLGAAARRSRPGR